MMSMALARLPLPARERRGSTVSVNMTDGRIVKGELLAVKADALLIYDKSADRAERLDLQQVNQVKVINKSKFLLGLAIGYGIGLASILVGLSKDSIMPQQALFIVPLQPGLYSGLFGALAGIDKKFFLAGPSSPIRQEKLDQLKRYAREQDFEKQDAD